MTGMQHKPSNGRKSFHASWLGSIYRISNPDLYLSAGFVRILYVWSFS